ncbi:type II toxin-antitoxin system antitoxin SocA domain-containing protein [Dactylosporangium sp. CA-052675]|uniref:type II toxin-antitoxin system antitoxin SocA domain-containing protein n=1 Tax=Dactylosporangium sp. CA-052675 TaxID=3239927 RepID=UPI003D8DD34B
MEMVDLPRAIPVAPQTVAAYLAVLDVARQNGMQITRTKIAKLLYLADLGAVEDGSDPISGVEWKWLEHGPFNYDLLSLENLLVARSVVSRQREEFYGGWELRLSGELPQNFELPEEDRQLLNRTMERYGRYAATTLKDMSYQTPPMEDAQRRGRGVVLNLNLARPLPALTRTSARMKAVLRSLAAQEDDEGAMDELAEEVNTFSAGRIAANRMLLDDN